MEDNLIATVKPMDANVWLGMSTRLSSLNTSTANYDVQSYVCPNGKLALKVYRCQKGRKSV